MPTGRFLLAAAVAAGLLNGLAAAPAQAAENVRVDSQITAHNLPYLDSPYVTDSTLTAGQTVSVECQAQGRENIGDTPVWYRVNHVYYPAYAFAGTTDKAPCGVATTVPAAAGGYPSPTFDSTARNPYFTTGDSVKVLCTAAGQTVDGNNAWFFVRGYWLHSSRIANHPNGNGYATCWGYSRPGKATVDDYPYGSSGVDPWGFYKGQCTSFVAWRLNDRTDTPFGNSYRGVHWGNADNWDDAARSAGIRVDGTPEVGAVAQSDAGSAGHVAWVAAVNANGTVTIEEYNYNNAEHYSTRTVARSAFEYLHF